MSYVRLMVSWMLALVLLPPCVAFAGNYTVPLRAAVDLQPGMVKQNVVWLSDLLPSDAPVGLRRSSAAIEICRAPQWGTVRILEADEIGRRLAQRPDLLSQLLVPPRISVRTEGWPIREESVRDAVSKYLRQQGMSNDFPHEAKVQWPEGFATAVDHPLLQPTALAWDERRQSLQVRVRCANRSSCGSFMVNVILPAELRQQWRENLSTGTGSPADEPQAAAATAGAVLAEKGKPATLIFDQMGMRISLRVICLQGGMLSQQIRVFDAQSRRVFRAEVVGAGLLHATL